LKSFWSDSTNVANPFLGSLQMVSEQPGNATYLDPDEDDLSGGDYYTE
jgi:hypothetical protein